MFSGIPERAAVSQSEAAKPAVAAPAKTTNVKRRGYVDDRVELGENGRPRKTARVQTNEFTAPAHARLLPPADPNRYDRSTTAAETANAAPAKAVLPAAATLDATTSLRLGRSAFRPYIRPVTFARFRDLSTAPASCMPSPRTPPRNERADQMTEAAVHLRSARNPRTVASHSESVDHKEMTRADMQLRDVAWTALSDHRLEPGQQVNLVRLLLADAEAGGMTLRTSDQRALRNVVASTLVRIPDGTTAPHQAAELVTTCMNHLLHLTSEQPQFLDANLRGSILRLGVKVTSWPHITDAQQLAVAAEVLRSIQKFPDAVATPVLPELTLALASRGSHG